MEPTSPHPSQTATPRLPAVADDHRVAACLASPIFPAHANPQHAAFTIFQTFLNAYGGHCICTTMLYLQCNLFQPRSVSALLHPG